MHDEGQLPIDRVRVRIFTLADHAAAPPDGKLYIGGGGIHQLGMAVTPGPIMSPLYVVARLQVPYLETGEPRTIRFRLLDEDEQPIGQDPVAEFSNVETGRGPGARAGDEFSINVVLSLTGFPVNRVVERELRSVVHLYVGEELHDTLPLKILRASMPAGLGGGG